LIKKAAKFSGRLFLLMVVALASYSLYTVITARKYTRTVIVHDLKNSQWRQFNSEPVKLELHHGDLNPRQLEILLKVQDPGFYNHKGVDLSTPGAGLTTVTQAIVKKLYFENFEAGIAKFRQSLIARFVVNGLISKDDQIALFINMMYFGIVDGKPAIGFQSASNAYYGRSVQTLSEEQYISLVAMLIMPETFHLLEHPEWNKDRSNRIKALLDGAYIPKRLMDQYYGELPRDVIAAGLPPFSYFPDLYQGSD
jgi:membrane carboxypeptidase/penicillin-binding protein